MNNLNINASSQKSQNSQKSTKLFLPTVKSNIKDDPVFYNVIWLNLESRLHFKYKSFL